MYGDVSTRKSSPPWIRRAALAEASAGWLEPARDAPPQPWPSAIASPPQPRRGAFCRCFNVVNLCRHVIAPKVANASALALGFARLAVQHPRHTCDRLSSLYSNEAN